MSSEDDDQSLPELIKKVVNEQSSEELAVESDNSEEEHDNSSVAADHDNDEQTAAVTTEDNVASAGADDETSADSSENTTPSVDSLSDKTTAALAAALAEDIEADEHDKVGESDPLLGAVTDLLSSILGLQFEQKLLVPNDKVDEDEQQQEQVQPTTTTEKVLIDDEPKEAEDEAATTPKSTDEIDRMIENLASSVGFVTEQSPTFVVDSESLSTATEPAAAEPTTTISPITEAEELRKENLAEIERIAAEVDEMSQLATLRQRINQVMNLVKQTEADIKLQNSNPSTTMNDATMTDVDDVVSGTLKELHSNLGISDYEPVLPVNTKDKIRNIESTINESLASGSSRNQDEQVFLPNAAKAALRYKYFDNTDF